MTVICGQSKEYLMAMVGRFAEGYRRGLKGNAGKSKVSMSRNLNIWDVF